MQVPGRLKYFLIHVKKTQKEIQFTISHYLITCIAIKVKINAI